MREVEAPFLLNIFHIYNEKINIYIYNKKKFKYKQTSIYTIPYMYNCPYNRRTRRIK